MTDNRAILFNLPKPLAIQTDGFEADWWPLVDSFWTCTQAILQVQIHSGIRPVLVRIDGIYVDQWTGIFLKTWP